MKKGTSPRRLGMPKALRTGVAFKVCPTKLIKVVVTGDVPVLPMGYREPVAPCKHKKRPPEDIHKACLKCRIDYTGYECLCNTNSHCIECANETDAFFALLRTCISRRRSKQKYRENKKGRSDDPYVTPLVEFANRFAYHQVLKNRRANEQERKDKLRETILSDSSDEEMEVQQGMPKNKHTPWQPGGSHKNVMPILLLLVWFNVTNISPLQQKQVGDLITNFMNQRRIMKGMPVLKNPVQPFFSKRA